MNFLLESFRDLGLLVAGGVLTVIGGALGALLQWLLGRADRREQRAHDRAMAFGDRGREHAQAAMDRLSDMEADWRTARPSGAAPEYRVDTVVVSRVRSDIALIPEPDVRRAVGDGLSALSTTTSRWTMGDTSDHDAPYVEQISLLTGVRNSLAEYLRGDAIDATRAALFAERKKAGELAQSEIFGK